MKILFQILVAGSLFYSCSQASKEKSTEESDKPTTIVNPAPASPAKSEPSEDNTKPVQSAAPNVALNPAHGMPGHRCDIEVGQPLTSVPAEQKAAVQEQNAVQPDMGPLRSDPVPAATLPTKPVAVRLNPAHGQPGHDCAVAVGAPLKN